MEDLWGYRTEVMPSIDIVGFDVEAIDGSIGKVDEATMELGASSLVVDTGFWIFGKKRVVPAGAVRSVDPAERTVFLSISKEQVKAAPDWKEGWHSDSGARSSYGDYYGQLRWPEE